MSERNASGAWLFIFVLIVAVILIGVNLDVWAAIDAMP